MLLVAFPAIYRSVTGWLERYFSLLTAVCASCFVHLSWTARPETSSATEAASSIVAHLYLSPWYYLSLSSYLQGLQSRIFA